MPYCIEEAVEHVQEKIAYVSRVEDILSWRGDVPVCFAFEGKTSSPDGVYENEEDDPAGDTASATVKATPIEETSKGDSSKDLGEPTREGYIGDKYQ